MKKKRVTRKTKAQILSERRKHNSKISHTLFIIILLAVILISFGTLLSNYDSDITGQVIAPSFNIEQEEDAEAPAVAALLTARDHKLVEDRIPTIKEKDTSVTLILPTSEPADKDDLYLYLQWPGKIEVLSFYMKGAQGSPYFELWTKDDVLIASGILTDEYKWYNFDVSSEKMNSEFYALYNYEWGGTGSIEINQVLAKPAPKPSFTSITGY